MSFYWWQRQDPHSSGLCRQYACRLYTQGGVWTIWRTPFRYSKQCVCLAQTLHIHHSVLHTHIHPPDPTSHDLHRGTFPCLFHIVHYLTSLECEMNVEIGDIRPLTWISDLSEGLEVFGPTLLLVCFLKDISSRTHTIWVFILTTGTYSGKIMRKYGCEL